MHHKEVVHLQKENPSKSNHLSKSGYPETKLCEGELSKSHTSYEPLTVRNLTRKRKEEQNVLSTRKRLNLAYKQQTYDNSLPNIMLNKGVIS